MTFTSNVPVSGDSLGSTRDRIRSNFQQIAIVEAVNHVAFNQTGQGKHTFLQMPEQVSAPVTLVDEAAFYSKVAVNPAEANLFFRAENNGFEYQLTKSVSASTGLFGVQTNNYNGSGTDKNGGWTFLPGGMLMQYGQVTSFGANSSKVIPFPVAFTSGCFSITLGRISGVDVSSQVVVNAAAGMSNFTLTNYSGVTTQVYWMAIGK